MRIGAEIYIRQSPLHLLLHSVKEVEARTREVFTGPHENALTASQRRIANFRCTASLSLLILMLFDFHAAQKEMHFIAAFVGTLMAKSLLDRLLCRADG